MASMTNPAGIKDDKRRFLTMVLIPVRKQHHAAMQNHQMRVRPPAPIPWSLTETTAVLAGRLTNCPARACRTSVSKRCLQNRLIRSLLRQAIGSGGLRHRPFSSICGSPSTACSAAISLRLRRALGPAKSLSWSCRDTTVFIHIVRGRTGRGFTRDGQRRPLQGGAAQRGWTLCGILLHSIWLSRSLVRPSV